MASTFIALPQEGGDGVTSLNGQVGALTLVAGSNIAITPGPGTLTISATGMTGGTVTSVDMTVPSFLSVSGNPITTAGTLAVTYSGTALPVANGGTGQTSASAAFGALSPLTTKGDVLGYSTVNARIPIGTNGQVLTADSAQTLGLKWATPTTGTVTSVAASVPSYMSISGSPITTSGTLAFDFISESQNLFFASPNGSSGAPSFRAIVAADVPTLNQNTTGTASNVTGVVALINGGTGTAAASANAAFNALSPLTTKGDLISYSTVNARLGVGTDGQVLTADSAQTLGIKWATPATGSVTSVAMTVPAFLSVAGSPITSSGTLAVSLSGTALPVANGGTGLTSGTSGGILGYTASGTLASSAALAANQLVLGGGAGATPTTLGSLGTTTTVLHGNAAGAPTFGAVSLTADITGTLAIGNGGTGSTTGSITGSTALTFAAGGSNQSINLTPTGTGIVVVSTSLSVGSVYEGFSGYTNSSTAITIPDTSVDVVRITLTGNATITFPAFTSPSSRMYNLTLFLKQDGTGNRTVTFAGNGGDTFKWDGGVTPTISPTADKISILQFTKAADETVWYSALAWLEN